MTDYDGDFLAHVHGNANYRKALGYWIGFLEGIIACKEITPDELGALKAQSHDLLSKFFDEDAKELVTELNQNWPDVAGELAEFIEDIVSFRRGDIELAEGAINEHLFFGFLKGIASDDVVNIDEVNALLGYVSSHVWERESIAEDKRVKDVIKIASLAVADGTVDEEESAELCSYITRVVGDSYADTGISEQADIPQLEGMVFSLADVQFEGSEFCLTGTFGVPKSVLEKAILSKGGTVNRKLRVNTRYLVLSKTGSEHYVTANAGTKILGAIKMRESGKTIEFIMESVIQPLIDDL